MTENPFGNPALAMLGSQMAQAWQSSLEAWWKTLLADGGKLGELAKRLSETGPFSASKPQGPGPEEISRLIEALELMEGRLSRLEGQLGELAKGLDGIMAYLERQSRGAQEAEKSDTQRGTQDEA